jgi:RNA polymerase sigma-70 factor (ECF subfamily)
MAQELHTPPAKHAGAPAGASTGAPTGAPRAAPAQWLREHGDLLWRFAIARVKDADAAEELVQDTLVAALGSLQHFRGDSTERTWLVGILRHKIADRERARRRAGTREVWDDNYGPDGRWAHAPARAHADPSALGERPEFWERFARCLALLPAPIAQAFVMREIRGVSVEAICVHANISAENAWVRLHRAREGLRRCLEPDLTGKAVTPAPAQKGGRGR